MKPSTPLVLIVSATIGISALADAPVWRRDIWYDTTTPGNGQQEHFNAIWIDAQGSIHGAFRLLTGTDPMYPIKFDGSFNYLYHSPAVIGGTVFGNAITGDRATGEAAVLRPDGMSVSLLDTFHQEIWRSARLVNPGITWAGGGIVRHPSGDYIVAGGDGGANPGTLHAARLRRSDGTPVWTVTYPSTGSEPAAGGIAIEPSGNVVIAGRRCPQDCVIELARLDGANGALLARLDVPFNCSGQGGVFDVNDVAVDASGNVFVVGRTYGPGATYEAMVVKLTPALTSSTCTLYGGALSDGWVDVDIDAQGRLAVAGYTQLPSGLFDAYVALLGGNGTPLWTRTYDRAGFQDYGTAVAFDQAGNVVAGIQEYLTSGALRAGFLRYDLAGNRIGHKDWIRDQDDRVFGLALDASGNTIAAGQGGPGPYLTVHKLGPNGDRIWSQVGTVGGAWASAVVVDGSGNIYLAGRASGGGPDWLVQKRGPSGTLSWEKIGPYPLAATDLAFTPGGDVVVVGVNGQLVQYAPAGAEVRNRDLPLNGATPVVVVDASGEVTVGLSGYDNQIIHLSSSLADMWDADNPFGSPNGSFEVLSDLAVDGQGDLYAVGQAEGFLALARVDASGAVRWQTRYQPPGIARTDGRSIAIEPSGHLLVGGQIRPPGTGRDVNRILRYHRSGTIVTDTAFLYPKESNDLDVVSWVKAIAVNPTGTLATLTVDNYQNNGTIVRYALDPLGGPGPRRFTTGEGPAPANGNTVRMFDAAGTASGSFVAYGANGFGTNVATGDIDTSAGDEQLTGPGPGDVYGPQVRAFTGSGTAIAKVNFFAYGTLKYGVNAASGGIDGDGPREILTGPGPGPVFGPQIRGWNYDGAALSAIAKINFFAYGTLKYGVNPGAGRIDGDAFAEVLTGPGPGSVFGPQVRGFNYDAASITAIAKVNFNAFATGSFGVNVATADLEADGFGEILAGRGPGAGLAAEVATFDFDGNAIAGKGPNLIVSAGTSYGANVCGADLDGDGAGDLAAGVGDDPAGAARVRAYRWLSASYAAIPAADFLAASGTYGVNVALGSLD